MNGPGTSRRGAIRALLAGVAAALPARRAAGDPALAETKRGAQRLPLEQLRQWESLAYGMFLHFGMSTFDGHEISDGRSPASLYAPDALDVDQWVSVARDAGMTYAVLTAKHVAGHCLWPSQHTDYTVTNGGDRTDVCGRFVDSCRKREVRPGFYYCSWDNHNRFGSRTASDEGLKWGNWAGVPAPGQPLAPFTTSVYQNFQTLQLTELLTKYGPIAETWIDIPGVLGPGYRTFLYGHVAKLQPETVVMMNSGIGTGETYDTEYAWPSDLIAIERALPPESGHRRWREIEGQEYYIPGEVCEPIRQALVPRRRRRPPPRRGARRAPAGVPLARSEPAAGRPPRPARADSGGERPGADAPAPERPALAPTSHEVRAVFLMTGRNTLVASSTGPARIIRSAGSAISRMVRATAPCRCTRR